MLFNARKNIYAETDGPVRYLDGSNLSRPLDMPRPALAIMGAIIVVAVIIGATFLFKTVGAASSNAQRAQASVEENIARPVTLDTPALVNLFYLDDATILQTFADAGFTTYNLTSTDSSATGGLDVVKLPSDVSVEEAALLYTQGVSNLSASNAALLLNGSWRLAVERTSSTDMSIKYADFKSGTIDAALQNAAAVQGFDVASLGAPLVDEAGNSYYAGTYASPYETLSWRISAISLSSVYSIKGLPDNAVYVGVRVTP